MNVCNKRIVLTSSRDSEEVFDSGLNLGWFTYPKEESRETFDKYYALWNGWKSCWESAAENDLNSVLFDLDYSQLTTEGSFRAVVMQMTYEIAQLLNLQGVDMGGVWRRCCSRDFQRELNPSLTREALREPGPGGGQAVRLLQDCVLVEPTDSEQALGVAAACRQAELAPVPSPPG